MVCLDPRVSVSERAEREEFREESPLTVTSKGDDAPVCGVSVWLVGSRGLIPGTVPIVASDEEVSTDAGISTFGIPLLVFGRCDNIPGRNILSLGVTNGVISGETYRPPRSGVCMR